VRRGRANEERTTQQGFRTGDDSGRAGGQEPRESHRLPSASSDPADVVPGPPPTAQRAPACQDTFLRRTVAAGYPVAQDPGLLCST